SNPSFSATRSDAPSLDSRASDTPPYNRRQTSIAGTKSRGRGRKENGLVRAAGRAEEVSMPKSAVFALFAALVFVSSAAEAQRPVGVIYPADLSPPQAPAPEPPPPCTEDCFLLSKLVLRGTAAGGMTFELEGSVRAASETKIPLFGPPSQVRIDDV